MDEKDFIEMIVTERMGIHCEKFKENYPPTPEQLEEREKASIAHDKVFSVLDAEHRKLLEFCEDVDIESSARENKYYYKAGIKDGVNLDRLVKRMKSTD
ncbi:hypothetical protein AALA98_15440 [Lachnospiraceae bacterium 45-W7]